MNNLIEIKNVSKIYEDNKKNKILNKVNFTFKKGKIYSLVGPSGSGKSTLLNLLSLIDKPTSGNIKIDNCNIKFFEKKKNDELRSKKIGIIYQDNNLLNDFNALENVYLARLSLENNKERAIKDSKLIIKNLGLSNRLHHLPSELSGGEMQRIRLATQIGSQLVGVLYVLDEPSIGLHPRDNERLLSTLKKLRDILFLFSTPNFFKNVLTNIFVCAFAKILCLDPILIFSGSKIIVKILIYCIRLNFFLNILKT